MSSDAIAMTDDISIGAQPSVEDLREMALEGTRSVINLRTAEESSPLAPDEEGAAARALGLEYAHVPVSGETLGPEKLAEFKQAMSRLPKPIHVHCARGVRAGAFALIHLAHDQDWTAEETFAKAEAAGVPLESGAMRDYVEQAVRAKGGG